MSLLDTLHPTPGLRILVVGGGGGIGAAIARGFQGAGSRVHVCDVDRVALDRLTRAAPGITGSMADASVPADVEQVFDDARIALGGLDVLVGHAGIPGPSGPIESVDGADWERALAVNLHSQFHFARRAAPLLKRSRASPCVITLGPVAGGPDASLRPSYAASRGAVVGLTQSLAGELGAYGVRVNALLPGRLANDRLHPALAALALFLCSPAAGCLTGQVVSVDGLAGG
jgi:NAD(P)-dependent dehydrogenase (short-subunit alcohol dehydrogenase family)